MGRQDTSYLQQSRFWERCGAEACAIPDRRIRPGQRVWLACDGSAFGSSVRCDGCYQQMQASGELAALHAKAEAAAGRWQKSA